MKSILYKTSTPRVVLYSTVLAAILGSGPLVAAPNNAPSFDPGEEPYSSPCDGEVKLSDWAQNATDNDGDNSRMEFDLVKVSNSDIFAKPPYLSWPSYTLSYRLKPGTAGGQVSEITAVLMDDDGTSNGGNDTSEPRTWRIFTEYCRDTDLDGVEDPLDSDYDGIADDQDSDDDNDGISDADEGNGLLDTDGDGVANSLDLDSDDDLILDEDENGDSDGDGIGDSEEAAGDDVRTDSDGDGIDDGIDLDDDNDGIIDILEGAGLVDTDGDGIVDSLDLDSDDDGRADLAESGLDVSLLNFDQNWVLENLVGSNGLVDLIETIADSGYPINTPVDENLDGIPDFQDPAFAAIFSDDPSASPVDINKSINTGLNGFGCVIGGSLGGSLGGSAFDPVLLLTLLLAFLGLSRRIKGEL